MYMCVEESLRFSHVLECILVKLATCVRDIQKSLQLKLYFSKFG